MGNLYSTLILKPCPFCGGEAEYKSFIDVDPLIDSKTGAYIDVVKESFYEYVKCISCGAEISSKDDDEENWVIRKWNTRVGEDDDFLITAYGLF